MIQLSRKYERELADRSTEEEDGIADGNMADFGVSSAICGLVLECPLKPYVFRSGGFGR